VAAVNLKPDLLTQFLISHLNASADLFALPDLRTSQTAAPSR
jgi:hypothetical protein